MISIRLSGLLFIQGPILRVDHLLAVAMTAASVTNEMCNAEALQRTIQIRIMMT
jgi:hypothetical protein